MWVDIGFDGETNNSIINVSGDVSYAQCELSILWAEYYALQISGIYSKPSFLGCPSLSIKEA